MRFVYPIEGKTAEELYKLNRNGIGGFYPIGLYNAYHGGIHIEGNHTVVSIADGTVIAYRYTKKYLEEISGSKTFKYSNSFILIRHSYATPKGQPLTFYSHYYHLCPWEELDDKQKARLPSFFSRPGFKITATGLNVRSSMDSSKEAKNIIQASKLKNGDVVAATAVNENWAKKDGVEEYFFYKGNAVQVSVAGTPEFDAISSCEIPIKAGALLGYTGLYEGAGILEKYMAVHVEVFAGDDTPAFVNNTRKDGQNKPSFLQIAQNTALMSKDKKHPNPETLVKAAIKADTTVTVLDKYADAEWVHVQEKEYVRSVKREWLEYHDDKTKKGDEHYTVKKANLADVSKAFNNLELSVSSQLKLVSKDGESNRKVRYTLNADEAEKFWVKKSLLGEIKNNLASVTKDIQDCYPVNPNAIVFQKEIGKTADEVLVAIDKAEKARDEAGKSWQKIQSGSIQGWISEDNDNLKKLSAFDWPGFHIAKEEGDTAYDAIIDFKHLCPFFKHIIDEINTDRDKSTISKEELKAAHHNEKIAHKLSRLVCFHQSEWWTDSELKYWDSVFKMVGPKKAELLKIKMKNLCWWDEVSQKCKDFLPTPNVYHWHPVAFVENMREMNIEPEWLTFAANEAKRWKGETEDVISKTINYHKEVGIELKDLVGTDHAWCASFVNYCLKGAGYKMFSPACRAKAVQDDSNFVRIDKPVLGSIGLVGTHHVGFVYAQNEGNNRPILLGGNQSDQINFTAWKGTVSFYLPKEYHKQAGRETDLPASTSDKLNEEFGIILNKKDGDITR